MPSLANAELMDVERAGELRVARHIAFVEHRVGQLAFAQDVFEPPDLVQPAHVQALAVADDAHRALVNAFVERQPAGLVGAEQVQPPALVAR